MHDPAEFLVALDLALADVRELLPRSAVAVVDEACSSVIDAMRRFRLFHSRSKTG
jgi:hypothetical protein